jgi:2-haloacid dehalogenase
MSDRWITFDCFGTLVDWHTGFTDILDPIAGNRTAELIEAYHEFERPLEFETPHRLYRDVLREGVARAAAKIGLPLTDAQKESLPQRWGTQPVFTDVEPALAELRAAGWKLAVLTNCDLDLFAQTQRAFQQPFDLVVTAEQVRDYKPSLAHFHYFRRVSGAQFEQWIHVAGSFYHDIGPAKQLSLRRIWVDRDNTGEDPAVATLRIPGIALLPAAVEKALGLK